MRQDVKSQKVAIVTGGTSGIGAACSQMLATQGFHLFLVYLKNHEKAQKFQQKLKLQNPHIQIELMSADLSQRDSSGRVFEAFQNHFSLNQLNVFIASHGRVQPGLFLQKSESSILRTLDEHLTSILLLLHRFLPAMYQNGEGKVILIGSASAHEARPGLCDYSLSKGALEILVKSLSVECAHRGLTFNSISPGRTRTEMTSELSQKNVENESRPLLEPEAVAAKVLSLFSEEGQKINGQNILMN